MAGGPGAQDVVVARLARIAAPDPGGWVPDPPSAGGVERAVPSTSDVADDATAARRALAAAMASYTAVHGHTLGTDETQAPRGFRLAVGARVAAAAVVVLLLVVGAVAVRAWQRTQSAAVPLPVAGAPAGPQGGAVELSAADQEPASGAPGSAPAVVVHVVGEVVSPGVVSLEPGARVADAVAAAGGATPSADLAAVNLARVLADGEQVVVPAPGQALGGGGAAGGGAASGPAGAGLVDLNRADAAEFDTLPGIGPVLAERIVSWRDEHGRFTAVEELTEVTGIGPALLAGVRDLVTVG